MLTHKAQQGVKTMSIQKIEGENYTVQRDDQIATIKFQGSLRLSGPDAYAPIDDLMQDLLQQRPKLIKLNLRDLKFLNSSGISMISKFVIRVRSAKTVNMIVVGNQDTPWQSKSLKNLQRLLPSLEIVLEWFCYLWVNAHTPFQWLDIVCWARCRIRSK